MIIIPFLTNLENTYNQVGLRCLLARVVRK